MAPRKTANTAPAETPEYDADSMLHMDPIAHIQKRPSLTLGPYDHMQLVALREVVDNSTDEVRAGHGKEIRITLRADGSATVEDSGRGVPTGINKQTGDNGIIMAFGRVGSGSKFGGANSGYGGTASLGLNGVGTTATNATSLRFDTIVFRGGEMFRMSFKDGKPGLFDGDNGPGDKFTPGRDILVLKDTRSATERKARPSGTTIRFWPNPAIFGKDSSFRPDELRDVLRSTAFLVPGVRFVVDDFTVSPSQHDVFEFDGGLVEMVEAFAFDKPVTKPVHLHGQGEFSEVVPVPQPDGLIVATEVARPVDVEVVFRWGDSFETNVRSYANTLHTPLGGTHVEGFERAVSKVVLDSVKGTKGLLKVKDEVPRLEDIREGMTAIVSINQSELSFVGQDKQRLGGTETGKVVQSVLTGELQRWFGERNNQAAVKQICQRVVENMRVRVAARAQKEVARKKTQLESSANLPSKLVECGNPGSEFSELLIVEGDSALGTMRAARDARFQALLPIRGKILNVHKASTSQMLANEECSNIILTLGAGSGKTFNMDSLRYSKVLIGADADTDGSHIRALLITFFWKYMNEFVLDGRLYTILAPLYGVKTHGKSGEVFYAADDQELGQIVKRLERRNVRFDVERNKGLGEMDAEPTWDTLLNPQTRRLRQITVNDVEAAGGMLELAMGNQVPPRRDWIAHNRDKVDSELLLS